MNANDFITRASARGIEIPNMSTLSRFSERTISLSSEDALSIADMPHELRRAVDSLAAQVMDFDGSCTLVMGQSATGKTFLWNQLLHNKNEYIKKSSLNDVHFLFVNDFHLNEFPQADLMKQDLNKFLSERSAKLQEVCFVTENAEVGFFLASAFPESKIIMELDFETFKHVSQSQRLIMMRAWDRWETISSDEICCKKDELVSLLMNTVVKKLQRETGQGFTKKQVVDLVDAGLNMMPGLLDDEGYILAPPGIWATSLRRLRSSMTYVSDAELATAKNKPSYKKHLATTLEIMHPLFENMADVPMKIDDDFEADLRSRLEGIPNIVFSTSPGMSGPAAPGVKKDEKKKVTFSTLDTLESKLKNRVFGQASAIDSVLDALVVPAAGLHDNDKPLRSFLFVGPTGVGKTQLAIELAKNMSTEELPLIRIDMSEYQQPQDSMKLFGSPPGYIGHDRGGILTTKVSENPSCILLLDEVEKAHPQVWDSFLQVLDSGRMTDSRGDVTDFTQTVVIMTSNIGVSEAQRNRTGFLSPTNSQKALDEKSVITNEIRNTFRPEFINRIDDVVYFNSISEETAKAIVEREVNVVRERMTDKGFAFDSLPSGVISHILEQADISRYGAREVQRVVHRQVANPLARHMVRNPKAKHLALTLQGDALQVEDQKG